MIGAHYTILAPAARMTLAFVISLHGFALRSIPKTFFDAAPAEQSKKTRYVILLGLFWFDHLFSIHKIHIVDVSKFVKCKLLSSGLS